MSDSTRPYLYAISVARRDRAMRRAVALDSHPLSFRPSLDAATGAAF
jgi:hypothetical protein